MQALLFWTKLSKHRMGLGSVTKKLRVQKGKPMKIVHRDSLTTCFILIFGIISNVYADAAGPTAEQQEINRALEMMKQQGMDPKQMQQMENMFKNMSEMGAQQKAARASKEQQEFEAATAGYGTARLEVEGKQYELKVTKCEVKDSQKGAFVIKAIQAPGMDKGELSVYSDGAKLRSSFDFSMRSATSRYYNVQNPAFEFDGKSLDWQGVVESDTGKVPLALNLSCGDEAIYYDKPSRPGPDTPDNTLTLYLGEETFEFEAGRCSLNEYRTGNLMVDFEATAAGTFRGRPAIILLTKSHGVGLEGSGRGYFHNFDLLLGELTAEQRKLSPLDVKKQLTEVVEVYRTRELTAYQNKYSQEMLNALPPEKMMEVLDASQKEMSQFMDRADAMRYPEATSRGGAITINGKNVLFRGPPMDTNDADRAPELRDLSGMPEIWLACDDQVT